MKLLLVCAIGLVIGASQFETVAAKSLAERVTLWYFHGPTFADHTVYTVAESKNIFKSEHFDEEKTTTLFFHGFEEHPSNESLHVVVNSYLKRGDHNIIILDWSSLVFGNYFLQSVPNALRLGHPLGDAIFSWFSHGLNIEKFHLVGHSLGAQLAGVVGRQVIFRSFGKTRLPRISGLDPAHPPFFPANPPVFTPLNRLDARFVDIVHTDAGFYGFPKATGHVDFWPNGGTTLQPGCPRRNFKPLTANDLCSHRRSWRYWAESVAATEETAFLSRSVRCLHGFACRSRATTFVQMGINAPSNVRGNFFLATNEEAPFSRGIDGAQNN